MPLGLGIASLIAGAAGAASKMGGGIAAANKLKRSQSPESIYADRYNQSFQQALNADLNNRLRAAGAANTGAEQVAAAQNVVNSLNTVAAAEAASRDASRYTDRAQQSIMNDVNRAQGIGDSIGGMLGATSGALGALGQGIDREAMLKQQQDRWQQNFDANQAAQAKADARFADFMAGQQQAADDRAYGQALTQLDQVLPQNTIPSSMAGMTPQNYTAEGMLRTANAGYGDTLKAADSAIGGKTLPGSMEAPMAAVEEAARRKSAGYILTPTANGTIIKPNN